MSTFDYPETVVEKVDNTNVIHRALVAKLAADGSANISTVMESLAAADRISEADVDAAAAKGWLDTKQVDGIKSSLVKPAREAANRDARKAANAAIRDAEQATLDNADTL